jgi:phosphate transport system permease protein
MRLTEAGTLIRPAVGRLSLERLPTASLALMALLALVAGFATLADNGAEAVAVPVLLLLAIGSFAAAVQSWVERRAVDRSAVIIAAASLVLAAILLALPEYLYGRQINGIIHRSLPASIALLSVGVPGLTVGLQRFLGGGPSARDLARYSVILLPVMLALAAYALLVVRLVDDGAGALDLDVLTTAYTEQVSDAGFVHEAGLRNHILGTLMLIGLTSSISVLPGVGAGVFMSEYGGPLAHIVRFSTTMLRAISVFIIGVAAFSLIDSASGRPAGDPISDLIRGYYSDANGFSHAAKGSFLTASVFLSLLVIPVIARSTEEGLRSVPREIREGSIALGATQGHGLLRILMPWAVPNIITGLLLGAAEAAGSVAVLLFIAGTGQYGVGPLDEATSLSFAIFETKYGPKPFQDGMAQYQFSAALLLVVITLGLTAGALFIKARFSRRYEGLLASD